MKKILFLALCILSPLLGPSLAEAAIDITFETTPLFGISNFLPGDVITKTVTVTNTGLESEAVYTELLNVIDGGLAPMLDVEITAVATLFSGSFNAFNAADEQFLSTLAPSATTVYTYKMTFKPQTGNEYQLKSLGFDICVGFSGGQFECDTDENPGGGDGGGGGGGNGGGGNGNSSEQLQRDGEVLGDVAPTPQILGDQVSIIPAGAPNTGFGFIPRTYTLSLVGIIMIFSLLILSLYTRFHTYVD